MSATHDSSERKPEKPIGSVLSVHGSQAGVGLYLGMPATSENQQEETLATVGKFVAIRRGQSLLVGVISDVTMEIPVLAREYGYRANARIDLMGQIIDENNPAKKRFQRGVKQYPGIGDPVFLLSRSE